MNKQYKFSTSFNALVACIAAGVVVAGCSGGSERPVDPPTKPLSSAEAEMLQKIEAMPQASRTKFARDNFMGLMQLSKGNKAFADRLNALLAGK